MPAPPFNSQFPPGLWISQPPLPSPQSEELNVDKPILSSHMTRLRDRDEYLWDIMRGGAAAPEYLDVSAIHVAGVPIETPFPHFMTGINPVLNGSFRPEIDLWYWTHPITPTNWYDVHVRTFTTVFTRRIVVQSNVNIQHHPNRQITAWFRLLVNGITYSFTDLTGPSYQGGGSAWRSSSGTCQTAITVAPGTYTFQLQFTGAMANILNQAIFQSIGNPMTSFLFH